MKKCNRSIAESSIMQETVKASNVLRMKKRNKSIAESSIMQKTVEASDS